MTSFRKQLQLNYLLIGIISTLLFAILWFYNPWQEQRNDLLATIVARGELRVGTLDSPLSYFTTAGNRFSGLDYELSQRFADYLDVKLTIVPFHHVGELFPALASGKVDILAAGLLYSNERLSQFRASPTYYSASQQLVYQKGKNKPKSLNELNAPLVISEQTIHVSTLSHLKKTQYPSLSWQESNNRSSEDLLLSVANGEIEYTVADSVLIAILQRIHPQLAVAFDITDEEPALWYFRSSTNDNLYAAMLDFFNTMTEEGVIAKLEEKYLGHIGNFDYVDTKVFLSAIDRTLPKFQPLFEKYADRIHWRTLAAIAYQESHWDPIATSPTGVRGIMMLTRATADRVGVRDRVDPEQSIRGGSLYLQQLMEKIPATIPNDEKIWFALAAYNMGLGHLLDVRLLTKKQGGDPDSWVDVKRRLPMLTQKHYYNQTNYGYARGYEAYRYVENIRKYLLSLTGYLQEKEKKEALKLSYQQAYPAIKPNSLPH